MSGPSLAEEEAIKRNTDCVYFLASPLTCKKGSECEYRHSDVARVNPRDCWFWLHSNCLNPKCGFRHPPLDGLLSTQTPTPAGQSATQPQNVTASTSHIPNASNKQAVPCVFFQKGLCLKGDWCPFLHTPNSVNNKASVVPGTSSAAEPTTFKKGYEKFEHEKKVPRIDAVNSIKVSQKAKPAVETETPSRKEFSMNRRISHMSGANDSPGYSVTNGNSFSWSEQPHLSGELGATNNKDVEEGSREPSPGFDVLVDDERRDSEYYSGEDHYGMPGEHEVRDKYDIDRATDFNMIADIDVERFQDLHGYGLTEQRKGQHALGQRRASSERVLGGAYFDRKPYARADSVNPVEDLDLRHCLNKRKKANGLRSVISHEHARERHVEERRYPGSNRDEQYVLLHENSLLSSHFRGRIMRPSRSPPNERDAILLGPDRGRLSPARTNFSSHQGRVRDRIKGRVDEDFHNGGKNHRDLHYRRDMPTENVANFTGPKSLAELKNQKNAQPSGQHVANQQSLGKRKHLMLDVNLQASIQQSGNDLSFDGPMPLEEILKRKRCETIGTLSIKKSLNSDGITEENNEGNGMAKISSTPSDFVSSTSDNKTKAPVESNKDVYKPVPVDKTESNYSSTRQPVLSRVEAEDDINAADVVDQDGESDYEQVGGENFDLYDGENGDADGEYLDDEDNDFAKKMGVVYS